MPIASALVTHFFQLIANKKFAGAARELEKIKQKMHKTEWNRGYFRALSGILLSKRNKDNYSFCSNLDFENIQTLKKYRREFLGHVRNSLHGDFDRGFFSAWADCMRIISQLPISNKKEFVSLKANREKGQETIERFFNKEPLQS
jgi:hypothetical protein